MRTDSTQQVLQAQTRGCSPRRFQDRLRLVTVTRCQSSEASSQAGVAKDSRMEGAGGTGSKGPCLHLGAQTSVVPSGAAQACTGFRPAPSAAICKCLRVTEPD